MGGWTRTSKENSNSCSLRAVTNVDACKINVEKIDIKKKEPTNSDNTILEELDISEETLTEENNSLLAVRRKRTYKGNTNESAEEFLLTRESVICFVQDSIANAVDRQKRNADRYGRANDLSFKANELVLLSTVNLPKRGH